MRVAVTCISLAIACSAVAPRLGIAAVVTDTTFAGDWGAQGKLLLSDDLNSSGPSYVSDETGGFFAHWTRYGSAYGDTVRVTRFTSQGDLAAGWTNIGLPVHAMRPGPYPNPPLPDGGGGIYFNWADTSSAVHELRLQHVLGDGRLDPSWPANGRVVPIITRTFGDYLFKRDDAGGFIVAWYGASPDNRNNIRAVRLDSHGQIVPGWPAAGVQVTSLAPDDSRSRYYAFLVSLFPGSDGNLIVQYGDWFSCSGHGCYYFTDQDAALVGPNGVISTSHPGVSLPSRDVVPDARGGAFSMINSSGYRFIEHLWSPSACYVVLEGGGGMSSDSVGGVLISKAARFSRMGADCNLVPGWGGESGREISTTIRPGFGFHLATDRLGGFFFAWRDVRRDPSGVQGDDLYALAIRADGSVAPGWVEGGLPVVTRAPFLESPGLISLGRERALLSWRVYDEQRRKYSFYGQRLSVDQPVPTQASLVSATAHADRIALEWFAADDEGSALTVERADQGSEWRAIASVYADGTGHILYEDRDVHAGSRYGYRLRDSQRSFAEAWVTVPLAAQFGIRTVVASTPSRVRVEFTAVAGLDVEISLFDLVGRRITRSRMMTAGADPQSVELAAPNVLAPGLYLVRVAAGEQSAQQRVMVLR